ncbi:hypothetical protein I3842_10G030200 [Carya illinoinensis]|uniref:Uncharacterized protein n=1 Tax=Carya illinoinensis TaxID=32201 RepID=A0A922DTW9_CARIL|nr:hypothetical protein I3842_10G030200 [Carya illinoinensis]
MTPAAWPLDRLQYDLCRNKRLSGCSFNEAQHLHWCTRALVRLANSCELKRRILVLI